MARVVSVSRRAHREWTRANAIVFSNICVHTVVENVEVFIEVPSVDIRLISGVVSLADGVLLMLVLAVTSPAPRYKTTTTLFLQR